MTQLVQMANDRRARRCSVATREFVHCPFWQVESDLGFGHSDWLCKMERTLLQFVNAGPWTAELAIVQEERQRQPSMGGIAGGSCRR
jgi:hypothetical protein